MPWRILRIRRRRTRDRPHPEEEEIKVGSGDKPLPFFIQSRKDTTRKMHCVLIRYSASEVMFLISLTLLNLPKNAKIY